MRDDAAVKMRQRVRSVGDDSTLQISVHLVKGLSVELSRRSRFLRRHRCGIVPQVRGRIGLTQRVLTQR